MSRIAAIALTVPDLDAAEAFYRDALGCSRVAETPRHDPGDTALLGLPGATLRSLTMRLGAQHLWLWCFEPAGRAYPADSTASDLWFQHCAIVVGDMAAAYQRLRGFPMSPISRDGPEVLPPNTGGVSAFKFRDPFGHPLELLHLPPDVGDPGWHRPGQPLFRGIDHTAIAVSDVAASAAFYAGLGFAKAERTHNTGTAQSRLDAVAGDDVEVQALAPAKAPPHLELLGYRTGSRRAADADWTAADVVTACTVIEAAPDTLGVPDGHWGTRPARLNRDPDGHRVLLTMA